MSTSSANAATAARLLVLSSLFPSPALPHAGVFIRARMFRVARLLPIIVVSPQPWFPLQGLIRRFRPHFRPPTPRHEVMDGVPVYRPRFLSVPGLFKGADGWLIALCCFFMIRRLVRQHRITLLDVHFGYPDGVAGAWLARWLRLPMVLTLRGKEARQAESSLAPRLTQAICSAQHVITVSAALRALALRLGAPPERVSVIGNGVDLDLFFPVPRAPARAALGLPRDAPVLASVGTLVERKGFHRVLAQLPALRARFPTLQYLIVGGAGAEGDIGARLRATTAALGLTDCVHFLGPRAPAELKDILSAADVFVLASAYEGWANVFLEAMACGLPVVTTAVGGNAEVVPPQCGQLVPLDDGDALRAALEDALTRRWDRAAILAYAQGFRWERRIAPLVDLFEAVARSSAPWPAARTEPTR